MPTHYKGHTFVKKYMAGAVEGKELESSGSGKQLVTERHHATGTSKFGIVLLNTSGRKQNIFTLCTGLWV